MADKNTLISGIPANISGVIVRQPTLHEIFRVIGYDSYSAYLYAIGITLEHFLEVTGLQKFFDELPEEAKNNIDVLQLMLAEPTWRSLLIRALSFFIIGDLTLKDEEYRLFVESGDGSAVEITKDVFDAVIEFINLSAGLKTEESKPKGFYNKAAQEAYEKLMALKGEQKKQSKKTKTNPNLDAWNVIGAVSAHSTGYTLINIWDLTMYQLYDQFGRICKKEYLSGYAAKWACWGTDKFDFDEWYKINTKQ